MPHLCWMKRRMITGQETDAGQKIILTFTPTHPTIVQPEIYAPRILGLMSHMKVLPLEEAQTSRQPALQKLVQSQDHISIQPKRVITCATMHVTGLCGIKSKQGWMAGDGMQ